MKKNIFVLSILGLLTVGLVAACGGGGGSSSKPKVDPFDALRNNPDVNKTAWYSSLAALCSEADPRPGCNYRYDGTKIVLQNDPHYASLNGFTFSRTSFTDSYTTTEIKSECYLWDQYGYCDAYHDVSRTVVKTFTNYNYYVTAPDGRLYNVADWGPNAHFYTDQLGGWKFDVAFFSESANGLRLISPTGIKYNYSGTALNATILAGESAEGDDLLGSVAEQKADQIEGVAQQLGAKFQLDADVSLKAAKALSDWSEIGSRRARTRADLAAFSKDVYGVELDKVEQAALLFHEGKLEQGLTEMNTLVDTAAKNWKTTPETMREVLSYFYGDL